MPSRPLDDDDADADAHDDEQPIIDKLLLFRLTGQAEITDPAQAQTLLDQANADEKSARKKYRATIWPHWRSATRMLPVLLHLPPLTIGVAIGALVAFALALPGIFLLDAGAMSLLVLLLAAGLFGSGMVLLQSDEPGETLETRPAYRRQQFRSARSARNAAAEALLQSRQEIARALRLIDGIQRSRNHDLERLLAVRWEQLDGKAFERFLETVFRRHGYTVDCIGRSGDQGVDLILRRDDVCIAVQAKRHESPVGNRAVQEVIAGRIFHKCDRCAVVTNSSFTTAARELADRAGCTLIGGEDLRALIRGDVRL
jgi:HJR/Mrr/RecB family endonuclease